MLGKVNDQESRVEQLKIIISMQSLKCTYKLKLYLTSPNQFSAVNYNGKPKKTFNFGLWKKMRFVNLETITKSKEEEGLE